VSTPHLLLFGVSCLLLTVLGASAPAQEPILAPGAKVEKVAGGCTFTEGPAADAEGNVYFSDCPNNRIMVLPATGEARVWKTGTRGANGMMFDREGRLVTCNSQLAADGRTVTRFEKDGSVTLLAERYNGKKLNSPNDLAIDRDGRIYFTDPRYGATADLEQDRMAVYRIETDGKLTRVIEDVQVPNGILITPDNRTLYLADHSPAAGGNRTLIAYDILPDRTLRRRKVLHDFGAERGIDGMALDVKGNIYATAGDGEKSGVYVFAPDGRRLAFIPTPETATNCTFGGRDLRTLYITAGESLYRVRTVNPGFLVYPPARP
jgi:gluconolactonase